MNAKALSTMTSRQRITAAMRKQDVDRPPVPQSFWQWAPAEEGFSWSGLKDELEWRRRYGFDSIVFLPSPGRPNPAIQVDKGRGPRPGQSYPLVHNRWHSDRGTLDAELRATPDYPYGDTIHFFNDYNTARFVKPLLAGPADLEAFIRMDPFQVAAGDSLAAWREGVRTAKRMADQYGAALVCDGGTALDYLVWASTAETAIMLAVEHPEETMAFLTYMNRHTQRCLDLMLEEGANIVYRRGWYDSTDFWSPRQFTQFAAPFIQAAARQAHKAGVPCSYIMCTGIVPLLDELKRLEFDCLQGIEPVATCQDLRAIVAALGDRKTFCTGVSAPLQIGKGTPDKVRQAVRDAFDVFGKSGLLLCAVPSIRRHWPWENVEAMMDEYRRVTGTNWNG